MATRCSTKCSSSKDWFGPSEITTTSITERRFERLSHELGLQAELTLGRGNLFNSLRLGKDEQKVYVEVEQERGGENRRASYAYDGQLWLTSPRFTHSLSWGGEHSYLKSYQNLQQRELVGYIYQYVQYGTLLRYTESHWAARLGYELAAIRDGNAWNRSWALSLDVSFRFADQRFRTFPAVFAQQVRQADATLAFDKNFSLHSGKLDLRAELLWQTGWGRCVDPVDADATNGYQYRADLQRASFDYLTAQALGGALTARYTMPSLGSYSVMPYVEMGYRHRSVMGSDASRYTTSFALGLKF